jgi:hypothetical protein
MTVLQVFRKLEDLKAQMGAARKALRLLEAPAAVDLAGAVEVVDLSAADVESPGPSLFVHDLCSSNDATPATSSGSWRYPRPPP